MSEHPVVTGDTAQAQQRALAGRLATLAEADTGFTAVLHEAHRDRAAARRRLDDIEAEIRRAVADPPDTPAGAAALRRLLIEQTRRIETIVAETAAAARHQAERLWELLADYRPDEPPGGDADG